MKANAEKCFVKSSGMKDARYSIILSLLIPRPDQTRPNYKQIDLTKIFK